MKINASTFFNFSRVSIKGWILGIMTGLILTLALTSIAAISIPNVFTNGQTLTAAQLNDNFTAAHTFIQPVGTIVSSLLPFGAFKTEAGDAAGFDTLNSTWSPLDGRAVTGSRYATVTGSNTLPDARGMFLRGLNEFDNIRGVRADGNQDPQAGRLVGQYQADDYLSHQHTVTEMIADNNIDGVDSTTTFSGEHHNEQRATGLAGGAETRAKNIALYYYIKIN